MRQAVAEFYKYRKISDKHFIEAMNEEGSSLIRQHGQIVSAASRVDYPWVSVEGCSTAFRQRVWKVKFADGYVRDYWMCGKVPVEF